MSSEPTPLFAFDIFADGRSSPAPDCNPTPAEDATYRWIHFDLATENLTKWFIANLPPMAAQTLLAARTRPRVDTTDDALLVTLRGINLNKGSELADMVSIRLWVSPQLVVTVRRQRVYAIKELAHSMSANKAPETPYHLLADLCTALIDRVESTSLDLEELADEIEEHVYDSKKTDERLPTLRRSTIKMRRHLGPLAEALFDLGRLPNGQLPNGMRHRMRHTANRAQRALDEIREVHDRLSTVTDHLDSKQTARLERNGYRLSIIAAIFLPLGFLTGVFGVNLGGIPGTTNPMGFWWLSGGMVVLAGVLALILRWLRWF